MIIAMSGFSKAGKDESSKGLSGFIRIAFADKLKEELASTHGISVDELECRKEEFRDEMVLLGRKRREEDEDYWIKKVDANVRTLLQSEKDVVITDCRYMNEALWVHSLCGNVVYIMRSGIHAANKEELNSISEMWNNNIYSHVIVNDGDIENLRTMASDTVKNIMSGLK